MSQEREVVNRILQSDSREISPPPCAARLGHGLVIWGDNNANSYANVSDRLRQAMTQNRSLRVFVANGYYDLATPFFATEYTFDHLGLDPELRDHLQMDFFEAGHMMYTQKASLEKLKADLAKFIATAAP